MNALRAIYGRLLSWLGRLIVWLRELLLLWLISTLILTAVGVLVVWRPCEGVYRLIGMTAQLVALALAAWALLSIRVFFELTPIRAFLREWWRRRPGWRDDVTLHVATGSIVSTGATLTAHGTTTFNYEASVADQLRTIGTVVTTLQQTVAEIDRRHSRHHDALSETVETLAQRAAADTERVHHRLRVAQTGGIKTAAVAALLAFCGTVLTAMPVEVASLFGSASPACLFPWPGLPPTSSKAP
jgi:hypothetical protein